MKKKLCIFKYGLLFCFLLAGLSTLYAQANTGDMWILPEYPNINHGQSFAVSLHVNTGSYTLASYNCTVTFPAVRLAVDTSRGTNGISAGIEGFTAAITSSASGSVVISGMDSAGKGPGVNLNIATLYFKALTTASTSGLTNLGMAVNDLQNVNTIAAPTSRSVFIVDPVLVYGDVNGSGTVDIVDALMIAQYQVGIILTFAAPVSADVNGDGNINIVDALIVAQYYVGLIPVLPVKADLNRQCAELVPVYPAGVAPIKVDPNNWNISVKLRNSLGAPLAGKTVTFSGSLYLSASTAVTGADGIATVQSPIPWDAGVNTNYTLTAKVSADAAMTAAGCSVLVNVYSPGMPTPTATPTPPGTPTPTPGYTGPITSYYLPASSVGLSVTTDTAGTRVRVSVILPDSCTYVGSWNALSRSGNAFSANANTYTKVGVACLMVLMSDAHTYDLGVLAPGTYTFIFSNWGSQLVSQTITIQ